MDRKITKKKWTIKRIVIYCGSGLLIVLICYSFILSGSGNSLTVERDKIKIVSVIEGDFQETIPVEGVVLPIETIRLDAIEGGVVSKKYSDGGTLVEKGDTIVELANNSLLQSFVREETQAYRLVNEVENTKLALQRNRFDLRRNLVELDYQIDAAIDAYQRGEKLFNDSIISEQEFLRLRRDYERLLDRREIQIQSNRFDSVASVTQISQSRTTLQRTKSNLEMIKKNLNNLYIKAPIAGRLSTLDIEVGESISPGQNIGQVDNLNGFKVLASVDEHYISRVHRGFRGTFLFANEEWSLEIEKVHPEVSNGYFQVDMSFDSIPNNLRRGQSLRIRLQLSDNAKATQIPRGGFFQTTGGKWLFVLNQSETEAIRREVRLGRQNQEYYEVLDGLLPGEKVVVTSYNGYEDKDKLKIK